MKIRTNNRMFFSLKRPRRLIRPTERPPSQPLTDNLEEDVKKNAITPSDAVRLERDILGMKSAKLRSLPISDSGGGFQGTRFLPPAPGLRWVQLTSTLPNDVTNPHTGNTAYQGGAVFSWGHTRVTNGTFSNNESECDGGAISAENDVTVTSSTFTGNITNCSGGAIEANNLSVTASTFKGNEANHIGGAVRADATATVTNSAFTSNSASWEGGAISVATGTVDGSRFTRNTSGRNGGAIYFYSPAPTDLRLMRRNTFSRNRAAAGGALTLGPCGAPSRSEAARVQRANRFSGNRATEQRRTNNIERWEGGCG